MSNEVINWEEKLLAEAKADVAKSTPSNSTISFKAGVVTYAGQAAPDNKLQCIVINTGFERAYYEGTYDPDNIATPACFGLSLTEAVTAPHSSVADPKSDACATCPMNAWGSAERGKGKACKERKRLALIPANVLKGDPEAILRAEVALARLPVTSVKNWDNYVQFVAASKRRPSWAVVTEITTKPDARFQFQVMFNYVEDIDPLYLAQLKEKQTMVEDVLIRPFEARAEAAPAPKAKGSKHV